MWEEILKPVNCLIKKDFPTTIVNSYLLSTLSLFVFNDWIVIKTCGETKIFEAILEILCHARKDVVAVKYTRENFFLTESKQSELHRDFEVESRACFNGLGNHESEELGFDESKFYFLAAESSSFSVSEVKTDGITVEILMKGLDKEKAFVFFMRNTRGRMTRASSVDRIFSELSISEYEFDPCGYSMNGIQGSSVYTIHVTPEQELATQVSKPIVMNSRENIISTKS